MSRYSISVEVVKTENYIIEADSSEKAQEILKELVESEGLCESFTVKSSRRLEDIYDNKG